MKKIRTYHELSMLTTFEARYEYLRLNQMLGDKTFGYDRYLNQMLYKSQRWLSVRDTVIIRDDGCDLGIMDYRIYDKILVHHINPITIEDIDLERTCVFDPEFLICTSFNTHNAIHFGDSNLLSKLPKERRKNDTCPWL